MKAVRKDYQRPRKGTRGNRGRSRERHGVWRRQSQHVLTAAFGAPHSPLRIRDVEVPCYVLSNGQRVVTVIGAQRAIGFLPASGHVSARSFVQFVSAIPAESRRASGFVSDKKELISRLRNPLVFVAPEGERAPSGYDVSVLPSLSRLVLGAAPEFRLANPQLVEHCSWILNDDDPNAEWIVDKVDWVTGFELHNKRSSLARSLEPRVHPGILRWLEVFPMEYFTRLQDLKQLGGGGSEAMDLVFSRLHMRDLVALAQTVPGTIDARGQVSPAEARLRQTVLGVVALMRASSDWATLSKLMDTTFQKPMDANYVIGLSELFG